MRTNIVLDDDLIQEAFLYTNVKTKKQLVELTLREFIESHRRLDVRELRHQIKLDANYDYKKMRRD